MGSQKPTGEPRLSVNQRAWVSAAWESAFFCDKLQGHTWAKWYPSAVGTVQDVQLMMGEVLPQAFQPVKGQSLLLPLYKILITCIRPPDRLYQLEASNIWKFYCWQFILFLSFLMLADWKIFWCSGWLSNVPAAKHGHVQAVSGGSLGCTSPSSVGVWVRAFWSP